MKTLIVALLVGTALSAVVAPDASGLEWLCNGAPLMGAARCATEAENENPFVLEDMGVSASVTCVKSSVFVAGSIGPVAEGEITEVKFIAPKTNCSPSAKAENQKNEEVANACTEVIDVKAVNLPWKTTLVEKEGTNNWWILLSNKAAGEPGYLVECLVAGLAVDDKCLTKEAATSVLALAENLTEGGFLFVDIFFEKNPLEANQAAKCSIGGAETGLVKTEFKMQVTFHELEIS